MPSPRLEPEEDLTTARTISVQVHGALVRCQVQGRGEPLVLVHGLAGSTAWWVRNVGVFSRRYTVYLVNLPGFGPLRKYRKQFSVRTAAAWLSDLLIALELEKVAMVGHSMGGLITALFAAQWPERLTKIILAAPAIALSRKTVRAYLFPLGMEGLSVRRSFLPTLIGDSLRAGFFTLLRIGRELLTVDIDRELSRINNPCLLVWGQRDRLVPLKLSARLHSEIRDSRLCVLPDAGHIVMYDQADQFNRAVLEFLE